MINECRKRLSNTRKSSAREPVLDVGELLAESAYKNLDRINAWSRQASEQRLTDGLAMLVEKHRAACGWILLYRPEFRSFSLTPKQKVYSDLLICLAANNSRKPKPQELRESMAKACLDLNSPVVYPQIVRRGNSSNFKFATVKNSSRSAVAAPIKIQAPIDSESSRVVGVVVLESGKPFAFTRADAADLQVAATTLSGDMVFQQSIHSEPRGHASWFPKISNWDLSPILNDFCSDVTRSIPSITSLPSSVDMTIWCNDRDHFKAFALGAAGFDHDYLCERTIATVSKSDRKYKPLSFVGKVMVSPQGTFFESNVRTEPLFRRRDKAERMEVDCVFATPISESSRSSDRTVADDRDKPTFETNLGAITLYSRVEATERIRQFIGSESLARLATIVGRFLETSNLAFRETAIAELLSRLVVEEAANVNTFAIIRDVITEVFHAEGCSIFAFDPEVEGTDRPRTQGLICVSTSGLLANGEELHLDLPVGNGSAHYQFPHDMDDDSDLSNVPHLTMPVALGKPPVARENSRKISPLLPPVPRHRESFLLTELEHRRALLFRVVDNTAPDGKEKCLGVIRIVRSRLNRPFTQDDVTFVQAMSPIVAAAFLHRRSWKRQRIELGSDDENYVKDVAQRVRNSMILTVGNELADDKEAAKKTSDYFANRDERLYQPAIERLCLRNIGFASWSRRRVMSVLQDLTLTLERSQPKLAMLRTISQGEGGEAQLSIHSYHGEFAVEPWSDAASEPIRKTEASIGWCSAHDKIIVDFRRNDRQFTVSFPELQDETRRGICVPVALPFRSGPMLGVVSIEGKSDRQFEVWEYQLIALASAQLSNMAAGIDSVPNTTETKVDLKQQVERVAQSVAAEKEEWDDWGEWRFVASLPGIDDMSSEFSSRDLTPLMQLRKFVLRNAISPVDDESVVSGEDQRRRFGRLSQKLEAEFFELEGLGVKIDVENARFCLPLWYGVGKAGYLNGSLNGKDVDSDLDPRDKERFAFDVCALIRELNWEWACLAGNRYTFHSEGWGIDCRNANHKFGIGSRSCYEAYLTLSHSKFKFVERTQ